MTNNHVSMKTFITTLAILATVGLGMLKLGYDSLCRVDASTDECVKVELFEREMDKRDEVRKVIFEKLDEISKRQIETDRKIDRVLVRLGE